MVQIDQLKEGVYLTYGRGGHYWHVLEVDHDNQSLHVKDLSTSNLEESLILLANILSNEMYRLAPAIEVRHHMEVRVCSLRTDIGELEQNLKPKKDRLIEIENFLDSMLRKEDKSQTSAIAE